MSKIDDMLSGLSDFRNRIDEYVTEVIVDSSDSILSRVKEQLFSGIGGDGQPLEPTYATDTYFRKPGAMERYTEWKERFSGIRVPDNGSPNLYINGSFHASMYADFVDGGVKITSPREGDIMEKCGVDKFAPTDDWMDENVIDVARTMLSNRLREALKI